MAEASIPVDLRNPGQVFACLGLMEAAHALHPEPQRLRREPVTGRYEWEEGATNAHFILDAPGAGNPIHSVIEFLAQAQVRALNYPGGAPLDRAWKVEEAIVYTGDTLVTPAKPSREGIIKPLATLPVSLRNATHEIIISHWGDPPQSRAHNVKLWAGAGGKPGAKFTIEALASLATESIAKLTSDPFAFSSPQSSSLNFDMRRVASALDVGLSIDAHDGRVVTMGYPLVELLAAIGLGHARPQIINKLAFRYSVALEKLPLILARPVLGCAEIGFPMLAFKAQLGWLGPEDKSARFIKDSRED